MAACKKCGVKKHVGRSHSCTGAAKFAYAAGLAAAVAKAGGAPSADADGSEEDDVDKIGSGVEDKECPVCESALDALSEAEAEAHIRLCTEEFESVQAVAAVKAAEKEERINANEARRKGGAKKAVTSVLAEEVGRTVGGIEGRPGVDLTELHGLALGWVAMMRFGSTGMAERSLEDHAEVCHEFLPLLVGCGFQSPNWTAKDGLTAMLVAAEWDKVTAAATLMKSVGVGGGFSRGGEGPVRKKAKEEDFKDVNLGSMDDDAEVGMVLSKMEGGCCIGGAPRRVVFSLTASAPRSSVLAARLGRVEDLRVFASASSWEQWFARMDFSICRFPEKVKGTLVTGRVKSVMDFTKKDRGGGGLTFGEVEQAFSGVVRVFAEMYGEGHELQTAFSDMGDTRALDRWYDMARKGLLRMGYSEAASHGAVATVLLDRVDGVFDMWQDTAVSILGRDFVSAWDAPSSRKAGHLSSGISYGRSALPNFIEMAERYSVVLPPVPVVAAKGYVSGTMGARRAMVNVASLQPPFVRMPGQESAAGVVNVEVGQAIPTWLVDARKAGGSTVSILTNFPKVKELRTNGKAWCIRFFMGEGTEKTCTRGEACVFTHVSGLATKVIVVPHSA
jgi:hypothetical protein